MNVCHTLFFVSSKIVWPKVLVQSDIKNNEAQRNVLFTGIIALLYCNWSRSHSCGRSCEVVVFTCFSLCDSPYDTKYY